MDLKYPYILLLAVPLILLLFVDFRNKGETGSILYPLGRRKLFEGRMQIGFWQIFSFLIKTAAICLFTIALARPQTSSTQIKRSTEGIDIMIAFDVSKSMLIEDRRNLSRIKLAKETTKNFVRGRGDDRIGFLMFSGESITLCPPTLDYDIVEKSIDAGSTNQLKDGTAIGDAIASSVNRLKSSNSKSKIVVLLTDGDNNMGSITPLTAGSLAKGYGIKVYSIALGREGMVAFPQIDYSFGRQIKTYTMVNSSINPRLLQQISNDTGGKFFRAENKQALEEVFAEINKLEKTKIKTRERVRYEEHFQVFLLCGLILILINMLVEKIKLRILPN